MRRLLFLLALWGTGCQSLPPSDALRPAPTPYVRSLRTASGELQLQVAVKRFIPTRKRGPDVWLVGVTHLGEAEYFQQIQSLLDELSVVLYEGVRGAGGASSAHAASEMNEGGQGSLQSSLAEALRLKFQLQAIDYSRAHFRNSDLNVDQLQALMHPTPDPTSSGKTETVASDEENPELDLLMAAMDGDSLVSVIAKVVLGFVQASSKLRAVAKAVMIETTGLFAGEIERLAEVSPGMKRLMEVLLASRNKKVMDDLRPLMTPSKSRRSIGVFYGAAHMMDMERRLVSEWGYRAVEERWWPAMRLNMAAEGLGLAEEKMIRSLVDWQKSSITGE